MGKGYGDGGHLKLSATSKVDWPSVIRNFRMSKRLKQAALAADLGVTQAMVSRWENAESDPPDRVKRRLAELVHDEFVVAPAPTWTDIVSLNPAISVVTDSQHCVRIASRGFLDLVEKRRGDVEGRPLSLLLGGHLLEALDGLTDQGFFSNGVAYAQSIGPLRFVTPSGQKDVYADFVHNPRIDRGEGVLCVTIGAVISEARYKMRLEERGKPLFVRKTF